MQPGVEEEKTITLLFVVKISPQYSGVKIFAPVLRGKKFMPRYSGANIFLPRYSGVNFLFAPVLRGEKFFAPSTGAKMPRLS